ncbi:MAG: hypothetical protein IKY90_01090 [Oscillospiraceae bacterium]|nr:hypothetical protein [Oscillospiraceae bacterium]MBR5873311.1 hypothetical protein [Oscillospiraceae bacterium]
MSTTIDSLSIEIQSNSASAAQGIDELAKSLGKLKQNGAVSVAVKNITALKTALSGFKVDNEAVNSVGRLVDNLRRLKEVKSGGLGTMVNSLAKLQKVTDGLNDDVIEAFTAKVKKLTEALTPLSDKMTTVKQAFSGINSMSKKTSNSFRDAGDGINTTTLNMSSFITVAQAAVQALAKLIEKLAEYISLAMEWDGVSARFGRGFGEHAEETYAWIQRLNEEMGINIQQFMQYSSIYATMLQGFGVNGEDSAKMALGYTELTYDIWAGYNDIYKTYSDAADAVKSAIAGEVEPIRKAGFTIIESTLEQTAANHGLSISLENATEAQKSYLRYLTLVEQAHSQNLVGTYAKELNTAEGLTRTLSQQLKSLAQSFGSLFLPVLVKVIPYIQAFVDLLTEAVRKIASFFGITIQAVDWSGYGAGISGAAESTDGLADSANSAAKAAKDLKKATIGIDELNIISPPEPTSGKTPSVGAGGAGFGGLDVDSLWDESIFDSINSQVDELKKKIKDMLPVAAGIALAIAGWSLATFSDDLTDNFKLLKKFSKHIKTLGKAVAVLGISIAVGKLAWDFTGAYLEGIDKNGLLKSIGTTVLGAAVAGWLAGGAGAGIVLTTSGVVKLSRLWVELKEGSVKLSDPKALATMFVGVVESVLGGALVIDALKGGKWTTTITHWLSNGLKNVFISGATKGLGAVDWLKNLVVPMGTKILGALGKLGTIIGGSLSGWAIAAIAAIVGVITLGIVDYDFTSIGEKFGSAMAKVLGKPIIWLGNVGKAIKDGFNSAIKWITETFTWDNITAFLAKVFSVDWWTDTVWPWMKQIGNNIVEGLWSGITGWWRNLKQNIKEFIDGFVKGWNDELEINSPSKVFERMGGYLIAGLWNGITGWFEKLIANVSTFVTNTITKVKSFFGITGNTSSTFKTIGGNLVQGVIDGITGKASALWSSLKSWADGVISSIKGFFGIHSPSTVAKKQIGSNIAAGVVEGVSEKANALVQPIKNMWNNAKNWWNRSKGNLTFTPSVGNLTTGLKNAWNTAKSWWNKNVKLSIPSLSLKVTYDTKGLGSIKKGIVKALNLPGWPSLKFAANGGMFSQGSMIWAGERGAEIVANAHGGKTGVMNVEQMQQAVYEGVLAAMMATQRGSGGNGGGEIKVYLDGRQINASIERQQKERGVSIMGREVYSY